MSHNRRSSDLSNRGNSVGFLDSDVARFWFKVDRSGACWQWRGSVTGRCSRVHRGYGQFTVGSRHVYAHRVAWEMTHGPIPAGLCVLHECDTPTCVNPAHLRLGTHRDNMRDAQERSRLHVNRPNKQQVSPADVARIIALRRTGAKLHVIADQFGVSKSFVSLVARGLRRHLDPAVEQEAVA